MCERVYIFIFFLNIEINIRFSKISIEILCKNARKKLEMLCKMMLE